MRVTNRESTLTLRRMPFTMVGAWHCYVRTPAHLIDLTIGHGRLSIHALATNATHAGGYVEIDVHNLWGLMEEKATHKAVSSILPGSRPFLISRSTFPSSGKWSGHWVSSTDLPLVLLSLIDRHKLMHSWETISVCGSICISASKESFNSKFFKYLL